MRNKKIFLLIALLIAAANTQTNWEVVTSNKNELVINLQANIKSSEDFIATFRFITNSFLLEVTIFQLG